MSEHQQEINTWKLRLDAANNAISKLEATNKQLQSSVTLLETCKHQWEIDKANQAKIIHQSLEQSNATNNVNLQEIQRLQAEIRELKLQG
ncbi:MAG: hypothetical protein KAS32_11660 [Candidatus Peribacteraceae bacterium]|nr:hypothetical protein [Candidatus Peribacteraceae bacterium]